MHKSYKPFFLAVVIFLNVAVDQISKIIVRKEISYNEVTPLLDKYLILTKVENTGAFLSAGNNLPPIFRIILLTALPVLVLAYGCWYLFSQKNLPKVMAIGIAFLIGGGIGNIYDRLMYGSVTDFLHMDFGIAQTGVFNVADMSIMLGMGLLLWQSFNQKTSKETLNQNDGNTIID